MRRAWWLLCALGPMTVFAHGGHAHPGAAGLTLDEGASNLSVDVSVSSFEQQSHHDARVLESVRAIRITPFFAFSPHDGFSFAVALPVVDQDWVASSPGFPSERVHATGLGDAQVALTYRPLLQRSDSGTIALGPFVGSSLGTGSTDVKSGDFRAEEHAQLGSGALEPFAGVAAVATTQDWSFFARLTGTLPLENANLHRHGASASLLLSADVAATQRLGVGLAASIVHAAPEQESRKAVANSGGGALLLSPALRFTVTHGVQVWGAAEIPTATWLRGVQRWGPTFQLGLSAYFFP